MTNSKVILTTIKQNLYIEVNLNMSSAKRRSFCLCSMAKEQPVAPPYQFRAKVTLYNSSWINGGRVTNMHGTKLGHLWSWWLFVSGRHQAITWTNAGNCKLGSGGNISEILIEIDIFNSRKSMWACRVAYGGHFVSASLCQQTEVMHLRND